MINQIKWALIGFVGGTAVGIVFATVATAIAVVAIAFGCLSLIVLPWIFCWQFATFPAAHSGQVAPPTKGD